MELHQKPYQFIEHTASLCAVCHRRVDAKIVQSGKGIFLLKFCPEHGEQQEILEHDAAYFLGRMRYTKPGTTSKLQTKRKLGCPFDCGLCPEHEQHTCIGVIEVTSACDLRCPVCYASSGSGAPLPLETVERMLDFFVDSEFGHAEILQISGGEPTTHPEILDIIRLARQKPIKYVMLNTNGLRIATDEAFVKTLSEFVGGFEIYLQFDGFDDAIYRHLRGKALAEIKQQAARNLTRHKIPVTLVSTIQRGVNDHEIGKIVEFGIRTDGIRGINFQPVALFGRTREFDASNRLTVTGIIEAIEQQMNGMIRKEDFLPLPCNVDRVSITYLHKSRGAFVPLTRSLDVGNCLPAIRNTFSFDPEEFLKELTERASGSGQACCDYLGALKDFSKFIPKSFFLKSRHEKIEYVSANTFRISITSFVDARNFDMKSMKKECVHIITPELKKIPFSAYNMLYREAT
ncbi:MAG: radical SAM protein [Chlorobaculum sp.]|jgi:7,8-dihydro-6-hydroxymethylpterin dimethyltransferase|nr:radical SAM protein [Chlorobaculum sp.]